MDHMYNSPTSRECLRITGESMMGGAGGGGGGVPLGVDMNTVAMEGNDESNDEIQR